MRRIRFREVKKAVIADYLQYAASARRQEKIATARELRSCRTMFDLVFALGCIGSEEAYEFIVDTITRA